MSEIPSQPPASGFPDPIPGIIPFGTVTIFAGAPGVGKTAMLAEWCQRWRDGAPICGHATSRPTGFYYLAADRQWASHQQWFNAVGFGDIPHYSLADDPTFDLTELLKPYNALTLLTRSLDVLRPLPGAHVFIDPISPLYIAGNPNASRDVARTLLGVSREAQARQINITCTAHFGKQKADKNERYQRPQDRIAGTGAFSGFSDTQIYLIDPEPPLQPYHVLGWVPRHVRPQEFTFTRNDHGLFVPYDVMKDDAMASEILDSFNETGATSIAVLRERAIQRGHSKSAVAHALSRLLHEGRICRLGRGRYQRTQVQ